MLNEKMVKEFLSSVDVLFPTPLSNKQNLTQFASKLVEKATICSVCENEKIVSMVAGYTENLSNNMAYISIVASHPTAQGNGYAKSLVNDFIQICKEKSINAVHLYTSKSNYVAIKMYENLGFVRWNLETEDRPEDLHLIYYMGEKR